MITCFFENQHKANLRHVTVDAIVLKNNQILLVQRSAKVPQANKFALPGGFLDRDETTKEGVLRELKEETGYQGKIINLFRIIDQPDRGDDRQNVGFVYLVKPIANKLIKSTEVSQIKWFNLDKLPKNEDFAFDHYSTIQLYLKYRQNKHPLPLLNNRILHK